MEFIEKSLAQELCSTKGILIVSINANIRWRCTKCQLNCSGALVSGTDLCTMCICIWSNIIKICCNMRYVKSNHYTIYTRMIDRVLFVCMYKMTGYYLSACEKQRGTICPWLHESICNSRNGNNCLHWLQKIYNKSSKTANRIGLIELLCRFVTK